MFNISLSPVYMFVAPSRLRKAYKVNAANRPRCKRFAEILSRKYDFMSDHELIDQYRLDWAGIVHFSRYLSDEHTSKGMIPPILKFLLALRFYSTGCSLKHLAEEFGVSAASCSNVIHDVSLRLSLHLKTYVKFPVGPSEELRVKQGFVEYSGFPNCIGAVDGTQIAIKRPNRNEEVYVNRKNFHSLNGQVSSATN